MKLAFGFEPGSAVTLEHDGQIETVDRWGQAHRVWPGHAGRINVLDDGIVSTPVGTAVRRKDGKSTLNLLDHAAAGAIDVALAGNRKGIVETVEKRQARGWAPGDFYMLETDPATGDLIVEPGRNHRKIYVTGGVHGLTRAQIAQQAGVTEAAVTDAWLRARPQYGSTEATALAKDVGFSLWGHMTGFGKTNGGPHSHWLLIERGYDYSSHVWPLNQGLITREAESESALHPIRVTTWGTGPDPLMGEILSNQTPEDKSPEWYVIEGLKTPRMSMGYAWNLLLADCVVTKQGLNFDSHTTRTADDPARPHRTVYRTGVYDSSLDVPVNGATEWSGLGGNHQQGIYATALKSLLIWNSFFDHNGWRDGYSKTSLDAAFPQPPTMYVHNMYLDVGNDDIHVEGCFNTRGGSFACQNRSGGANVYNFYLDNNIATSDLGGRYGGAGSAGQYGYFLDNVVTSAACRLAPTATGAMDWALEAVGQQISIIDNVVVNKADPSNPAEIAAKNADLVAYGQGALPGPAGAVGNDTGRNLTNVLFNNTRAGNWRPNHNMFPDNEAAYGVDPALIRQTTIQVYAAAHAGFAGSTIPDYLAYLRSLPTRQWKRELDDVMAFFRQPWGLNTPKRVNPVECVFLPDYRTDGFRADNRLNWSTKDIPGDVAGDTIDLDGNWVRWGRHTRTVAEIAFNGGSLDVSSGKLVAQAHADHAKVTVRLCGQYFAPAGRGDYVAAGGRLAFTGPAAVDLEVSGVAECLFGPALTVPAGKELTVVGGDCWAGWDGTGTATVTGALAFVAAGGRIGKLRRFKRNGNHADPTVTATVNLTAMRIDATGLGPGTYDLGGGTGTGVTYVNQGATLPAGVTLAGGKLSLVV